VELNLVFVEFTVYEGPKKTKSEHRIANSVTFRQSGTYSSCYMIDVGSLEGGQFTDWRFNNRNVDMAMGIFYLLNNRI
jgi:hypothetical protein